MPRVGCIVFSEFHDELPVELCELFLRLTPVVACRRQEPRAIFLDFRGIDTELPEFEKLLNLKVKALVRRWSGSSVARDGESRPSGEPYRAPRLRIGLAENAGFAFLLAQHPEGLEARLSATVLDHLLDPFAVVRASQKQSPGQINAWMKLLTQLGIHTLRDFSLLPPSALASRFGKSGLEFSRRIRDATSSADLEAWPLFVAPEKLIEQKDFDPDRPLPPLLDPILFTSKELLDRLSARLRARMLRATAIRMELHHEGRQDRDPLVIRFCTPQGSAAGMLPSFRERLAHWLQQTESEDSPLYGREILNVTLEVIETSPGHRSQRDFFHSHEDQAESWDSLLSRLSEKMGPEARFQVRPVERHLPEKAWAPCEPKFTTKEDTVRTEIPAGITPEPQLEIFATRPTRLLREPLTLEHDEGWLRWPEVDGIPGRRKRILRWFGPERICEGWWESETPEQEPQRDYFRAVCQGGIQIWGYFETPHSSSSEDSSQAPQRFHLQGYFD
jgi:nucleotidyltransferase/DNA polymerase involved in DNA repair